MHLAADNGVHAAKTQGDARTARILARSIYKDMRSYGIPQEKILEVASELIGLVTAEMSTDDLEPPNFG